MELKFRVFAFISKPVHEVFEAVADPAQLSYYFTTGGAKAVKRNISIGRKNPQFFEVLSGLEPGEEVITSSYESFGDKDELILN